MDAGRSKKRAASLSVVSNIVLVLGKLAVGLVTTSVAVISEAIHSAMDLVAAVIALVAVSLSARPPDPSHPHGHGKIEELSGAIEALLIFGAVVYIGYESIDKLIHGSHTKHAYLGAITMGVSAAINFAVSWHLQRVATRTDSTALRADAAHLRTDVYTSCGVLVGLLLVHFTGLQWLDPAVALVVGLLIVWEAWEITRRSVGVLLDESLPASERQQIEEIISRSGLDFHALRSRKSGATRKIDLHLEVNPAASIEEVHEICDEIESDVERALPGAQVLIHPEPHLEPDSEGSARATITKILDGHRELFSYDYDDLHLHTAEDGLHVAVRVRLQPTATVQDVHHLAAHLGRHIVDHLPQAQLFIQPEPEI